MDVNRLKPGTETASPVCAPEKPFHPESQSPEVRDIERIIAEIGPTEIPVLLLGDSGTGKEVLAQRIHRLSVRRDQAFVKVVCTMLSDDLLEEPFAGKELRGSGRVLSGVGTLFLDEISDLSAFCQPKLLHILPDGDTLPHERVLTARVISASSRDLEEQIRSGRLRKELYYRLNGVCLHLPPLRRRKEDIPGLVDFFLTKYSAQFAHPKPSLSPSTMRALLEYSWPGNIRQLENTVKKIIALGDEQLALADLEPTTLEPRPYQPGGEKLSLKEVARAASRQAEREMILKSLERTHWNRKRAARELQISYKALLYKLKQIGLDSRAEPSHSGMGSE